MKVDLLKQLNYDWRVVAKTPCSQKFIVDIKIDCSYSQARALVDVHYVKPYSVYASIAFIGEETRCTTVVERELFSDLEKIANRRHGAYDVIAYTLTFPMSVVTDEIPI